MNIIWLVFLLAVSVVFGSCSDESEQGCGANCASGDTAIAAPDSAESDTLDATSECPFADDGVCDEPASCAFGTDAADCDAACAAGGVAEDAPAELWGACAYREGRRAHLEDVDEALAALGSNGFGGRYGWSHGTVWAKSPVSDEPVERYYTVYVPDSYQAERPAPVLFYLPGFGVEMYGKGLRNDINHLAERHGIVVVYLAQHMRNMGFLGWLGGWHVYNEAFIGDWANNPDLDFLRVMKDEMFSLYNIDRSRIYLSGHSRGAGMSIIIGTMASSEFTGVLSQSGFVGVNGFETEIAKHVGRKIPMVIVHGKRDDDVWVGYSNQAIEALEANGWLEGDNVRPYIVPWAGHRWQPQLNEEIWEYLYSKQLPIAEVTP